MPQERKTGLLMFNASPKQATTGAKIQRADMPGLLQGYENHPNAQALTSGGAV
jgi:hypothetical protein